MLYICQDGELTSYLMSLTEGPKIGRLARTLHPCSSPSIAIAAPGTSCVLAGGRGASLTRKVLNSQKFMFIAVSAGAWVPRTGAWTEALRRAPVALALRMAAAASYLAAPHQGLACAQAGAAWCSQRYSQGRWGTLLARQ